MGLPQGGVSPTICCGAHAGCQPKVEEHLINKDMAKIYRIRKFTPRECFRLMGVSDADVDKIQAYPLIPQSDGIVIRPEGMTDAEVKKLKISESQEYKMAGNSIVVPVLEGIFTQMFKADSDSLF